MKRRDLLTSGTATLAATAATISAAPAISQGKTQLTMVTSWPKNLPGPGVSAQNLADRIGLLSGGRLEIKLHAAGEIVPSFGVFDAVSEGTADMYHSVPAYWSSKSKGLVLFGSQPFGLSADEQVGWMTHGGAQELYDESYANFGLKPFLCGNSGPQWFGWFRNEINSVDDLKGLKYRTSGLAADMCAKLGMATQAMSGGEMFQALQSGAIDAGEFVTPWTDSALGFYQVAPYYYWPGIGEPSSAEECVVNKSVFDALPTDLQMVIQAACGSLYNEVLTEYLTKSAQSLPQLVSEHGVKVKKLPDEVLMALGGAAKEVFAEMRDSDDPMIKKITESFISYRDSIGSYSTKSTNGVANARALVFGY